MRRSAKVQRFLLLGLSGPIIALNIWLLSLVFRYFEHLITVVAIAAILAFLMNYPVRILEQMRVSRTLAVVIVLLIAITILVISGLTLVPILVDQAVQLLKNIPAWLQTSNENLLRFDTWAQQHRLPINLKDFAGRINTNIESQVQLVATQAVGVALGTVSGFLELILVVLAFYMLLYGDRVWQDLINLLPAQIGQPLSTSLRLNFQNFFLSQLLLGLFMVGTLTPSFLALKVPFSL